MNIYHVDRVNACGYDEYDGFVVLAKDPHEALKMVTNEGAGEWDINHVYFLGEYSGEKSYENNFILSSYNAG